MHRRLCRPGPRLSHISAAHVQQTTIQYELAGPMQFFHASGRSSTRHWTLNTMFKLELQKHPPGGRETP
eukprot:2523086-Amphidinium_carterae.1